MSEEGSKGSTKTSTFRDVGVAKNQRPEKEAWCRGHIYIYIWRYSMSFMYIYRFRAYREGEPTQTNRDYLRLGSNCGPIRNYQAPLGLISVPRLLWVGTSETSKSSTMQPRWFADPTQPGTPVVPGSTVESY